MIDWYQHTVAEFERIVNLLVKAEWSGDSKSIVEPVDGRGGDAGVDIDVKHHDNAHTVYQLKFFRDGISGGNSHRRKQITDSWNRIKERNDVLEWVLVLPTELTPAEKEFLQRLENPNNVKISYWGKADLDFLLTKHPQIANYADKTPFHLKAAQLYQTERAELLDPVPDLVARVTNLGVMGELADPNYSYAFEYSKGYVAISATPHAGTVSAGIKVNLRVKNESEQHEKLTKVVGFGLDEQLTLGEEVIDVTLDGPFEVPANSDAIIKIHPPTNVPETIKGQQVTLEFDDENGNRLSSLSGVTEHVGVGPHGFSWRLRFFHCLSLTMFGPNSVGASTPDPIIDFKPVGSGVQELFDSLNFILDLSKARQISISIAGQRTMSWNLTGFSIGSEQDVAELLGFCNDLKGLESRLKLKFAFVKEISPGDVAMASTIRLLLDGKRVIVPVFGQIDFDADASGTAAVRAAYESDPENLYFPGKNFLLPLLGTNVNVGDVDIWNPNVTLTFSEVDPSSGTVHVTAKTPEGQCFIFTPLGNDAGDSAPAEIYWPVPRQEMPDWVLSISDQIPDEKP